jgi:ADP-ribose pyrophosphatase YjhB (NUDIX family)
MQKNLNPHISVDCVIFGFDSGKLKVLLIKPQKIESQQYLDKYKLPGNLIQFGEPLLDSANRILNELTGLSDIFLKQFGVFDDPDRLYPPKDREWLEKSTDMEIKRVITIAYYSLVEIENADSISEISEGKLRWHDPFELPKLFFDHNQIISKGLETLQQELLTEPLAYELLPEKFTLNQLQKVYEAVLKIKIDNRNFRKKINRLNYIISLNEKQKGVANRPAILHGFDRQLFDDFKKEYKGFII